MEKAAAEEFLKLYCDKHHIADVKGALLKWLVVSCKENTSLNTHVQTKEFTEFYDELNKMITCVYTAYRPNA